MTIGATRKTNIKKKYVNQFKVLYIHAYLDLYEEIIPIYGCLFAQTHQF